jgi:hypothetical protein
MDETKDGVNKRRICHHHKAQERSGGKYANGQKRCQVCQIYMKCDGLRCPCCKSKLRTKSRNSAFKKRLADAKKYQGPKNKIQPSIPVIHKYDLSLIQF